MFRSTLEQLGFPPDHWSPVLAYHDPTKTMIVHTTRKESLPAKRLFSKRAADARYELIADFPASISIESFVLCSKLPIIYFITFAFQGLGEHVVGGDWDALYELNLLDNKYQVILRAEQLKSVEGRPTVWLTKLLSVNEDSTNMFVIAGYEQPDSGVNSTVKYYLSSIVVPEMQIVPISELHGVCC